MISHSPSHSSVGLLSSSGWPWKRIVGLPRAPQSCASIVLVDVEHAVDRRFVGAGQFGHHHVGEAAVAAEDGRRADLLGHAHDVAQFDHGLVAGHAVGRHRRRSQKLAPRQIAFGQPHDDLDRVAAFAAVRIADRGAAEQRRDRVVDVALLDAEVFEAILVDRDAQPRPRLADRIVDVDDVGHRGEDFLQFVRRRRAGPSMTARRPRRAASPAPAGRAALRPRGRPCRPASTSVLQPRAQIERDGVARRACGRRAVPG